jgi:hypothetical protein
VEALPTPKEEISKIQHLNIKIQTTLVGEEIRTIEKNIDIETISFGVNWDYNIVVRETNIYKDIKYYHFISVMLQRF